MLTAGIIAEYNPFHNGHALHIQRVRQMGADAVVCVISGCFTQRGEPAVISKRARTVCALKGGADVVISMPAEYSCAPAADFARAGVYLLDAFGGVDVLSFGSETGDINLLLQKEEIIRLCGGEIKTEMKNGAGYAAAVQSVLDEKLGGSPTMANDILGCEYISAAKSIGADFDFWPIRREGVFHNGMADEESKIASASYIREKIVGNEEYSSYLPEYAADIIEEEKKQGFAPCFENERFGIAVLSRLRMMSRDDIKRVRGVSEGLENRIISAVKQSSTLEQAVKLCVTKRYTAARVRRCMVAAAAGLFSQGESPEYIRVLGFTKTGEQLIKRAAATSKIPIVTGYSQIKKISRAAERRFGKECAACDLYDFSSPLIQPSGREMTFKTVRI